MPPRTVAKATTGATTTRSKRSTTRVTEPDAAAEDLANDLRSKLTITKSRSKTSTETRKAGSSSRKATEATPTTDELADRLEATLNVKASERTTKKTMHREMPTTSTPEERKADAMRTVNAASQALSAAMQTKGNKENPKSNQSPRELSKTAREGIVLLRSLMSENLDVERAASSVVGKLIALELIPEAVDILRDMHPSLLRISGQVDEAKSDDLGYLFLPLLLSDNDDPVKTTLYANYLSHALSTISHVVFGQTFLDTLHGHHEDALDRTLFAVLLPLGTNPQTLLYWHAHLTPHLTAKQADALLSRAYSSLVKSSAPHSQIFPRAVFALRGFALLCLLRTEVLDPAAFWEQTTKFCVSLFHKTNGRNATSATKDTKEDDFGVLTIFKRIVESTQKRSDAESFMTGKYFITFCECWLDYATRARDTKEVDRISELTRGQGAKKASLFTHSGTTITGSVKSSSTHGSDQDGLQLCVALVQAVDLLEKWVAGTEEDELRVVKSLQNIQADIKACHALLPLSEEERTSSDQPDGRLSAKLRRVIDKLRRVAVKSLDSRAKAKAVIVEAEGVLLHICDALAAAASKTPVVDFLSPALDTYFVLSRVTLIPTDADSHTRSYKLLEKASLFPGLEIHDTESNTHQSTNRANGNIDASMRANYVRCISGAFHNLSAVLYQAGKHASAARFLRQACELGLRALEIYQKAGVNEAGEDKTQVWTQLADQVYRRWELLGVCYSKIGERKLAYKAFIEAIAACAHADTSLEHAAASSGLDQLFGTHPQLGHIVDRATYIATSDLLLAPVEVPLNVPLRVSRSAALGRSVSSSVLGVVLERQVICLEQNKWKEHARDAIRATLAELLNIYSPDRMPLRRLRVLVKCLQMGYYSGNISLGPAELDAETILKEIVSLSSRTNYARDALIAPSASYNLALAYLWCALHSHEQPTPGDGNSVPQYAENACRVIKTLISSSDNLTPPKITSEPMAPKSTKSTATKSTGRRVSAIKATASRSKRTPAASKAHPAAEEIATDNTTPSRATASVTTSTDSAAIGDVSQLLNILETVSTLLGLVGDIPTKLDVLNTIRSLSEKSPTKFTDAHIRASCELASEYIASGRYKKAAIVYTQAGNLMKKGNVSDEVRVLYLLRLAESMARSEDILSGSTSYCDALGVSGNITYDEKGLSTYQRVHARVSRLELAALAAATFATIQNCRDDPTAALEALLQALRLWNRAAEHLARLNPPPGTKEEDLFAPTEASKPAPAQSGSKEQPPPKRVFAQGARMDGFEWRIAEGTLRTLFALSRAYLVRGSAREAEYFAQQAEDLAQSIRAPAMVARALARRAEVQLHCAKLEEGEALITQAGALLPQAMGVDAAEITRLHGLHRFMTADGEEAQQSFARSLYVLSEAEKALDSIDRLAKVFDSPTKATPSEIFAPALLAAVLRQHIWLLRDEPSDEANDLLTAFTELPSFVEIRAEQQALLAKMTLHEAYSRFSGDMFLNSLAESTIALPMGMTSTKPIVLTPAAQEVLTLLGNAEQLFWSDLALLAQRGKVVHVREAATSLAMVAAFRSSLGRAGAMGPAIAARLLDVASAITLRREMLEVIPLKFRDMRKTDDLRWPMMTPNGTPMLPSVATFAPARTIATSRKPSALRFDVDADESRDDDRTALEDDGLKKYWADVEARYKAQMFNEAAFGAVAVADADVQALPHKWIVITMSVTEDKATLFVSRRRAGEEPVLFCLPLKGRREMSDDDEAEHLGYEDAVTELVEIIRLSDENTRGAINVDKDDKWARAAWWAERGTLDKRLKELLESIEFCWLGAFKTILHTTPAPSPETLTSLRSRFDKTFSRALGSKQRSKTSLTLDNSLLQCFAALDPKCRDEELEDVVYFVLDLYQTHGVPVVLSEIDVDQLVIDLRAVLEQHHQTGTGKSQKGKKVDNDGDDNDDAHVFLVLDKNLQGIPWESIPVLRGKSVSRIPDLAFLADRVRMEAWRRREYSGTSGGDELLAPIDRASVNPTKGYYVLNPSGDLKGTEERLRPWVKDMKSSAGWSGIVGRVPSEQEFLDALERRELVVYFGHGGGEQYVRSHKIRHLPRCAATMLWGCSSGALREMGEFDRTGTPWNYMLAGCPTLVANLWDVTDKDIDKFTVEVLERMALTKEGVRSWSTAGPRQKQVSVVSAVAKAREVCKLKYLTGAAPVVYGIPFYL